MKRPFSVLPRILCTLTLLAICSLPAFSEPANLSLAKNEIKNYHDSGLYEQELTKQILKAQQYLIEEAKAQQLHKKQEKLALVLDIDETSLSNYDKMVKRDFVANHQQIHQEILAANSPPIKPMLALYQTALDHGIKVFFVTGRNESERKATRLNLIKAGYTKWSGLYLRPQNYSQQSIKPFKSQARAMIAQKGYTILASIGDQYSDIEGGHMKKGFKLPNPFYYLP